MKEFKQFILKSFPSRGYFLTPIEFKDVAPFAVKRAYYVTDLQSGSVTGEHCHKVEEEVFVMVRGSCTAIIDRGIGAGKEEIPFAAPGAAMYVPNLVWHGFKNFSPDAVLLALSSTNYSPDRSDYVENYDEYVKMKKI